MYVKWHAQHQSARTLREPDMVLTTSSNMPCPCPIFPYSTRALELSGISFKQVIHLENILAQCWNPYDQPIFAGYSSQLRTSSGDTFFGIGRKRKAYSDSSQWALFNGHYPVARSIDLLPTHAPGSMCEILRNKHQVHQLQELTLESILHLGRLQKQFWIPHAFLYLNIWTS